MSWQLLSRQSEDAFLCLAESCGVEGVIRLYASTVAGRLSQGVRGRLAREDDYYDRELRVQVLGPRCTKLKNVKDIEDFKTAFRSLVRGESAHLVFALSPTDSSRNLQFQRITISTSKLGFFIETSAWRTLWSTRAILVVESWLTWTSLLGFEMETGA